MTKSELKKLKEKLPHGFGEIIAEKTDYATTYVYQVLGGRGKCPLKILDAAKDLAQEAMQKEEALKKFLADI